MVATFILAWFAAAVWVFAWFFAKNPARDEKGEIPLHPPTDSPVPRIEALAKEIDALAQRLQVMEKQLADLVQIPAELQGLRHEIQVLRGREDLLHRRSTPCTPFPVEATPTAIVEPEHLPTMERWQPEPIALPVSDFDQKSSEVKPVAVRGAPAAPRVVPPPSARAADPPTKGRPRTEKLATTTSDPVSALVLIWRDTTKGNFKQAFTARGFECRDWDNYVLVRGNVLGEKTLVFPLRDVDTGSMIFRSLFEAPAKIYSFNLVKPALLAHRAWVIQDIGGQLNYLDPRKGEVERC